MRHFLLLFALFPESLSYKLLVYSPLFGHSHATFLGRIADSLADAGHNVTVLLPIVDHELEDKTTIRSRARQIKVTQDPRVKEIIDAGNEGMNRDLWTVEPDPFSLLQVARNFSLSISYSCERLLKEDALIESLRKEHFDVAIAEPVSLCGLALFDHLKINKTIGALSSVQFDLVSWFIGEPLAPSYVPSMFSTNGDKMSLLNRLTNALDILFGALFIKNVYDGEIEPLTSKYKRNFDDYNELIARFSFVFTNANSYLNFPRPLIHKTVEIGGISVDTEKPDQLDEKWNHVLGERPHTVLISFGSVAKSKDMPPSWKKSVLDFCGSLPNVSFIWKYEESSTMADHLDNVYLSPWIPQNALLADPRLSIFITHGGLGSSTELAHFGKPAIMIPLFADQPRNAKMLSRHGGVIVLEKNDIPRPEVLKEAVQKILNNESYAQSAKHLASMLREQPISPKDLVIKHAEFVAEFGPLEMLDPQGRHLNILQYYLVDVVVILAVIVTVTFGGLFGCARFVF